MMVYKVVAVNAATNRNSKIDVATDGHVPVCVNRRLICMRGLPDGRCAVFILMVDMQMVCAVDGAVSFAQSSSHLARFAWASEVYFAHSVISNTSCANVRMRRRRVPPAQRHVVNGNDDSSVRIVAERNASKLVIAMTTRSSWFDSYRGHVCGVVAMNADMMMRAQLMYASMGSLARMVGGESGMACVRARADVCKKRCMYIDG